MQCAGDWVVRRFVGYRELLRFSVLLACARAEPRNDQWGQWAHGSRSCELVDCLSPLRTLRRQEGACGVEWWTVASVQP